MRRLDFKNDIATERTRHAPSSRPKYSGGPGVKPPGAAITRSAPSSPLAKTGRNGYAAHDPSHA